MGMFVRALAYMMSHGADGLRQVSGDAVLNANYLLAALEDDLTPSFPGPCMHEALFDDRFLEDTGVTTLDFAKALIDEGYHPMTMYFPLVVHGALADRADRDREQGRARPLHRRGARRLAQRARRRATPTMFRAAPRLTPRRRLDETPPRASRCCAGGRASRARSGGVAPLSGGARRAAASSARRGRRRRCAGALP